MKKNARHNKRSLKPAAVLSAVLFFVLGLQAASSSVSDSLLDDVTAMITNSKKLPHTIFVIDTSESMNTFAYSDYIDTCADGKANVAKAIILCDNAYKQCRNVEANASCTDSLGCEDVQARCFQLRQKESDLKSFCDNLEVMFKEPARDEVLTDQDDLSKVIYVGPWNPKQTYKADLCFYDWSQDTDGDVLAKDTSGHWTNPTTDISSNPNTEYYNSDRRDWDCITDGKDNMYDGKDDKGNDKYYSKSYSEFTKDYKCEDGKCTGGLGGLWLNWKYATSLDAVKIILANVHSFSYPPRSRGANECYGSFFYPVNKQDPSICYVDFNTDIETCASGDTTCENSRKAQLEAIKASIMTSWESEYRLKTGCTDQDNPECYEKFDTDICKDFSVESTNIEKGFSIFPRSEDHYEGDDCEHHKSGSNCERCLYWNSATKEFEDVECSYFKGEDIAATSEELVTLTASFTGKTCCKTFQCTNPKCRDNDICCKDNAAAYGEDATSDGYKVCIEENYSCSLGFYSEYDQDKGHCCGTLDCKEAGETQSSSEGYCDECKSGAPQGNDIVSVSSNVISVIAAPDTITACHGLGYQSEIPIQIKIGTLEGISSAANPQPMESLRITVNYRCNGCNGDNCSKPLGTFSCTPETCAEGTTIVSSSLSECENEGYSLEAYLEAKRTGCKFGAFDVKVGLEYEIDAYKCGSEQHYDILDPEKAYYQIYRMETSASETNPIVNEYECKTAFYHRQVLTVHGSRCPSASAAPALLNQQNGSGKVEYCDPGTAEREVIDEFLFFPTEVACSWQCRDAIVYEDPWKCASFFYMMNETKYNGLNDDKIKIHCGAAKDEPDAPCTGNCKKATDWTELEQCCVEIAKQKTLFTHLENPVGVTLSDGEGTECWVSGYQFGTASNGSTTTTSGYMAELVTGHIKEAGSGSYRLTPYETSGAFYSPYDYWYEQYSLYVQGQHLVNNTFISAFKTSSSATREPACIYDLMYAWEGEDCGNCEVGCCSIDLGQQDNGCDYPQFWMKVPMSDGGQKIFGAKDFSSDQDLQEFRNKIKALKAVGGATLGETLYDVWRYLGGMYAMYDPEHIVGRTPYESPFKNQDAVCFTNEAVVISGGQPQFDHNDAISDTEKVPGSGVSCGDVCEDEENTSTCAPCVAKIGENLTNATPYYEREWYQTSILNVALFAKNNSFWAKESCRTTDQLCKNIVGFENVPGGCGTPADCHYEDINYSADNANKPVLNRVHAVAIGEWALSQYYSIFNSTNNDYLNKSLLNDVAEKTGGYYYGLTTEAPTGGNNPSTTGQGGTFQTLTSLFTDLMNKPQKTDVVAGRPHWTSSLVQPYDVEEKYRGPETYSAGAVPIDGEVSRFWFGNLKKYMLDDDSKQCSITNDASGTCGAWTKQKFESPNDCFMKESAEADGNGDSVPLNDDGTGFSTGSSADDFKILMMGGAAYKLAKKLGAEGTGDWPYFQNSPRKIYYDAGGNIYPLNSKVTEGSRLHTAFALASPTSNFVFEENESDGEDDKRNINKILDYMAGYDAFKDTTEKRKHVRYGDNVSADEQSIKVDDPINIDFNQETKISIRPLLLGAIIHSKPVAVYYENSDGMTTRGMTTRIYAGANDGMLHSFNEFGDEVYAYIPSLALGSITNFGKKQPGIFFNATVDGPITLFHIDQSHDGIINEGETALLIFGYRRGAKGYTVIDISDPDQPKFVQNINNTGTDLGGYSFGKVAVFRKCTQQTCSYAQELEYYIAVPGGYDTCYDPVAGEVTSDATLRSCSTDEVKGNKFSIFKFTKSESGSGSFVQVANFSPTAGNWETDSDKDWLVASFGSVPFVVNTSGKAAVNTEYVYFTDLSGSVFRVDVTDSSSSNWKAKLVFAQRKSAEPQWSSFSRSYVAANFFPPLERYNPGNDPDRIPITLVTGNAANPKYVEQSQFLVFYDKKTYSASDPIGYDADDFLNNSSGNNGNSNQFLPNDRGWYVKFAFPPHKPYEEMSDTEREAYSKSGEKGITEPMVTYDIYGGKSGTDKNSYSVAWNTYIPKRATQCRSFGTSSNYERMVLDGSQGLKMPDGSTSSALGSTRGEWDPSKCSFDNKDISIATGVGIVASKDGYDLVFGAGADVFRKKELTVKANSTHIIKWYELY